MAVKATSNPDQTPDGGVAPQGATPPRQDEFPTEWHRTAYIEALQREADGAEVRDDDETRKNVARELTRLGVVKETRPRGAGKQTRA